MAVQTAKIQNLGGSQILYNDLRKRAASADGNLADEYSASKTYAVGDFVMHLDKLYRCKTAITTAEAWTAAHWEETSMGEETSALKSAIVTKAEEDGYYEELTAGSAEQLVSTEAVTDTTPYLYRKSGGSADVGNRETLEKIVGGTVNWNQLFGKSGYVSVLGGGAGNGLTWSYDENTHTVTIDGVCTARSAIVDFYFDTPIVSGHAYLMTCGGLTMHCSRGGWALTTAENGNDTQIIKARESGSVDGRFEVMYENTTFSNKKFKPQLIDLTAMFGPTIADYIYNLEQATAGAGVAWFRKLFPKDYYPYNPGELISVKPSSHDMVEFNLWDEEWEVGTINPLTGNNENSSSLSRSKNYIRVRGGEDYYFAPLNKNIYIRKYDASKNYIGYEQASQNTSTGSYAHLRALDNDVEFIRIVWDGNTYNHDICINLSNSGSRNGECEPYEKHSYPLADVELRGPLAIDADGKLVYNGDEYPPDGNVKRKYGLVNLGTLNWAAYGSYTDMDRYVTPGIDATVANDTRNAICTKYQWQFKANGFTIGAGTSKLSVLTNKGEYADAASFKAAMSGVYLLYELATPITETVAPYTPVQVVDDWGTEEFVDTREVAIPVGHSTSYMANLRDKLQHLPSLAEEDGEYIVKQTGTKMELAKFSSVGAASAIVETTESMPVVSIKDGADGQPMRKVEVAIEPVQDLHGYDSPWPAGGNTNKIEGYTFIALGIDGNTIKALNTAGTCVWFKCKQGQAYTLKEFSSSAIANRLVWAEFATFPVSIGDATSTYATSGVTYTAQNDGYILIYRLNSQSDDLINSQMIVEGSTEPTTFSPYSNICPISGWTGAKVTRTGKNLLAITEQSATLNGISFVIGSDGTITANGTATANTFFAIMRKVAIPAGNYVLTGCPSGGSSGTFSLSSQINSTWQGSDYGNGRNIALTKDGNGATWSRIEITITNGVTVSNLVFKPMLRLASDIDDAYEPYQGQTYEVTFPSEAGTVYGGTLDVVTGKLVVDRVGLDLGNANWAKYDVAQGTLFRVSVPGSSLAYNSTNYIVSNYKAVNAPNRAEKTSSVGAEGNIDIIDSDYADATAFKNAMAGQTAVYPLATPVTYQLTPQEIKTLLGANNIWSDAGNTAITYPADTKLYIEKRISELQALILENL